jgi:hypothetical protein
MQRVRRLAPLALLVAAGCAAPEALHLESASAERRECAQWYQSLDAQVDAAGVRDAQHARVPGFPYLRIDRMAAAWAPQAAGDERLLQALIGRMQDLDLESRRHEIENLSPGRSGALLQRSRACARVLKEADLADPQARAQLLERSRVPDDYSTTRRVLGLYALTRLPFAAGVKRWEQDTAAVFAAAPAEGARIRYAPPPGTTIARETVASLLSRARYDPLRQPALSEREAQLLAAAYAPSFDIGVSGEHDRIGELRWRDAATLEVDAARAVVYVLPAYTRYGEHVLLQLAYTIWFAERPAQGPLDLLAGRLDGLVWRVTLAPDGEPLLYDAIHPCGCFHQFFPTARARPRPAPDALEEWAFVPHSLPRVTEGERPLVRLAAGTHAIERVSLVRGIDSVVRYAFRPYDELRSLPRPDGSRRSAFGPDGRIAGTERAERFFFWPMGIVSPGAMRQWGRQPTAFVGRRHFDDADLIERRFDIDLAPARRTSRP